VRSEEVLQRVWEERIILRTVKRRNTNWIGHILCGNCLLKLVMKGKVEGRLKVTVRRERRRKQLLITLRKREGTGKWKGKH
jgi:hypothetical protein